MALLCALAVGVGCASVKPEKMVTPNTEFAKQHPVGVALTVEKTSKGEGWYSKTVKPEKFEEAIRMSIEKTRLFAELQSPGAGHYLLNVTIVLATSHPGFNMTAWINADWQLVNRETGEEVWAARIEGQGKATVGEALNGNKRMCIALERAGQSNINQALSHLAELNL